MQDTIIKMSESDYLIAQEEYLGYCRDCGAERDCCEPDAENYKCESCGAFAVYGAEQLLIMGLIEFTDVD